MSHPRSSCVLLGLDRVKTNPQNVVDETTPRYKTLSFQGFFRRGEIGTAGPDAREHATVSRNPPKTKGRRPFAGPARYASGSPVKRTPMPSLTL